VNILAYKEGYKYVVADNYLVQTAISGFAITTDYINLYRDGTLLIRKGYAWDGPSGPAIDTKNFIRGSLVHDVLYQLIREDRLPFSYRLRADDELARICQEDGMMMPRRWWVKLAVNIFGANAVEHTNPVLFAPEKINETTFS